MMELDELKALANDRVARNPNATILVPCGQVLALFGAKAEERELLSRCALAIGAIAERLADGASIQELQELHQSILREVAEQWQKVFGTPPSGGSKSA